MDPDRARDLAVKGATLLVLGMPPGSRVGLDHQSFVTADNFKGFKMVPPGPHYFSYNATSRQGEFGPTVAFLVHLNSRKVLVRRWSTDHELLLPLEDEDEAQRYTEGVRRFDFDSGLAPYALHTFSRWQSLTPHVTSDTIQRLMPRQANVSITAEADPAAQRQPTAAEQRLDTQLEAGRADAPGNGAAAAEADAKRPDRKLVGRCRYVQLPRLQKGAGLSPAELTAQNLDKSALLEQVLQDACGGQWQQFLAELEMAFTAFLYGQSLEGFAQWKDMLQLTLSCEKAALEERTPLFVALMQVLQAQFTAGAGGQNAQQTSTGQAADAGADMGALIEELLPQSFLQRSIGRFLEMLDDNMNAAPPELANEASKLKALLQTQFGILFDIQELGNDSDDEDAPVVVEL